MSNFVMNDSENLYINSACVTGPTIENLMVGPCVNEEYLEPQFEDSDEKFNERIDQMLREEEDLYDEMIAADRLNDVDYYEHQENYLKYFGDTERQRKQQLYEMALHEWQERENEEETYGEFLKRIEDEYQDLEGYFGIRKSRWSRVYQQWKQGSGEYDYNSDDDESKKEWLTKLDRAVHLANR